MFEKDKRLRLGERGVCMCVGGWGSALEECEHCGMCVCVCVCLSVCEPGVIRRLQLQCMLAGCAGSGQGLKVGDVKCV